MVPLVFELLMESKDKLVSVLHSEGSVPTHNGEDMPVKGTGREEQGEQAEPMRKKATIIHEYSRQVCTYLIHLGLNSYFGSEFSSVLSRAPVRKAVSQKGKRKYEVEK